MRLGRNDLCWCGSGIKYKNCHLAMDEKIAEYEEKGAIVPDRDIIKTPEQIKGIREAGRINTLILDKIEPYIQEGISTEELDQLIEKFTKELGGVSACMNYQGYPKNACISIDDVVCHGIPSKERKLKSGDIVNIDVSTIVNGYFGDSSRMYCIGDVSEEKKKLVQVTKESVELALKEVKPWGFLGDIGYVINEYAKKNGYQVVREIGGHGVGIEFHEEPWVSHIGQRGTDMLLVPGMIFTIEPMINMGTADVYQDDSDGWTIYTQDGKPSAQWENMVLVTETGMEILAR